MTESFLIKLPVLLNLVQDHVVPWRGHDGTPYADVRIGGDTYTAHLGGSDFDGYLYGLVQSLSPGAFYVARSAEEVRNIMMAKAFLPGEKSLEACQRIGEKGALYYDLGWQSRELVRFEGGKWKIVRGEGPKFVRGKATLPQVRPEETGEELVDLLRPHLATKSESDIHLLVAWVLGTYKVGGPFPILMLTGEQGSAKSTTTRLLRKLVDPHGLDVREPIQDDRDFQAAVRNTYVLAFDNLSFISHKMSDSLCRVATGVPLGGRTLYKNHDESAFQAMRPIILNGIPDVAEREDFSSRVVSVHLPRIDSQDRKDDDTYWEEVAKDLPKIMGAVFNAVAKAREKYKETTVEGATRMVSFVKWAKAGLGDRAKDFERFYNQMQKETSQQLIDYDVFVQSILSMMRDKKHFQGSVYDLVGSLKTYTPNSVDEKTMPTKPRGVAERLKRAAPVLRDIGIEVYKGGREGGTGRRTVVLDWTKAAKDRDYDVSAA